MDAAQIASLFIIQMLAKNCETRLSELERKLSALVEMGREALNKNVSIHLVINDIHLGAQFLSQRGIALLDIQTVCCRN